ncbi:hypothetical protein [Candidatus Ferrigenium straubiae]|jgi:hypothetical protein|uniref:hypothetical protein n=1 Tax=Candidatus Ferrigenium straubiae TaxID=2919506 RepID=UPI003F4ABF78
MLSGIFGKKNDHPMADIKSAQALVDDLPKNDAYKSLTELGEWIESVADGADLRLDHQFVVLCLLDEAARPHARKLVRDYFTPQELNKFQENRLWLALDNYYRHAARAYCAVFGRYCGGDKGAAALKAQLPLLVARAVHALAGQLKYTCTRYGPVDKTVWNNLAQLYRHAEQQQYLETPLVLYPGGGETTVKGEVGRLLGWHGCGVSTLRPLYVHLTERIVGQYCARIEIGAQQDANSLFSFDLDRPAAPVHFKVGAAVQPSMRFVGMAKMQPEFASLVKTLEKGVVPDSLNLGGAYDAEPVREAVQYLLNYLTAPPSRRSARRSIKVGLNVVSGFDGMIERTDIALNFSNELPAYWDVEDISASGFRTILPVQGADGIRIGSLLGVQPEGVPHWGVAVVRRLMRDEASRLHAGAEMLANQIAGVNLSQSGGGGGFEDGQPALWLQAKAGEPSGEARLLMKAGAFSAHRSLQTRLNGKSYLLIPHRLQEKGFDYDLASFRVIEQELAV